MKELIEKYRKQYKDVPDKWKFAVIDKVKKDPITFIDVNEDKDFLYDQCIYYLFDTSVLKIKNLAKKLNYNKIPCDTCRKIIKHWNDNDDVMWNIDDQNLFVRKAKNSK